MKVFYLVLLLIPISLMANMYSLDELIEYGLEHSYQIQKEELNLDSAQSSLNSALWSFAPQVNLNAGLTENLNPPKGAKSTSSSAGFEISKSFSLNEPSYFNYRQSLLERKNAELRYEQSISDFAYRIFLAYLNVLSTTRRKSALEENLAIQERVWEQSKVLLRLGKTTPFETKQHEIAVMNSQISIMQLENSILNARSDLFNLIKMEDLGYPLEELEVDGSLQMPAFETSSLREVKAFEIDEAKLDLNIRQNNLNFLPSLNLSYGYSRQVSGADFDFDRYGGRHSASLSLSYPLLSFFTNRESSTRYKISKQLAQLSLEDKIEQSKREYEDKLRILEYLIKLDELYFERLQQASQQINIAEERYRLGLIETLELDKTRTAYVDSSIEYNNNRYEIIKNQEAINYLLSKPILGKW